MSVVIGRLSIASKTLGSVTTVSGLAFAPAAVLFLMCQNTDPAGSSLGNGYAGGPRFGVLTASGQFALSSNRYLTDVDRRHSDSLVCDAIVGSAAAGAFSGALTSDGFTLTCTDATAASGVLFYIVFGGTGISATSGSFTAPASPGVVSYNLGIRPHLLFHWTLGTLVNSSASSDQFGMGMVAQDLGQCSYSARSGTNDASGSTEYCTDQEGFAYVHASTAALDSRGVATAWTPTGVTIDWAASSSQVYHYLAIRGLSSRVVSLATAVGVGNTVAVAGLPWQPDAGIMLSAMATVGFHAPGTPTLDTGTNRRRRFSTGAWKSPTERWGMSSNVYDTGNLHTQSNGRDRIIAAADQDGGIRQNVFDLDSITSDGFVVETTVSSGLTASKYIAALVMNDTIPVDQQDNAPFWGTAF